MTVAVPVPRPTVCLCDGRPGPHGYGDSGCLDAVPGPRFRDQLAKPIDHDAAFCCGPGEEFVRNAHEALYAHEYRAATHHGILDALLPAVRAYGDARAAEVEARVQAAANQRAAEIVARVKAIPTYTLTNDDKPLGTVVLADDVVVALASPASPTREATPTEDTAPTEEQS